MIESMVRIGMEMKCACGHVWPHELQLRGISLVPNGRVAVNVTMDLKKTMTDLVATVSAMKCPKCAGSEINPLLPELP